MATITVTTLNDSTAADGQVSLREALQAANTNVSVDGSAAGSDSAPDTIVFAAGLAGGTIRLGDDDGNAGTAFVAANGTLAITEALTIDGDIDGDGKADITITGDRSGDDVHVTGSTVITDIFATAGTELDDNVRILSATAHLTLDGLVLTGGVTGGTGGAVSATGGVTLTDSTVSGNSAGSAGGGIYGAVAVTLTDSIVSNNKSGSGGGLFAAGDATLVNAIVSGNSSGLDGGGINVSASAYLTNSTISGNSATRSGGGIEASTATLTNSTVSGNSAGSDGAGIQAGTANLTNSTVSGNVAGNAGGGVSTGNINLTNSLVLGNVGGDLDTSSTHRFGANIVGTEIFLGDNGVGTTTAADVFASTLDVGGGVLAGVLADTGGPVETIALKESVTNPAIDAGIDSIGGVPDTDARGQARFDFPGAAHIGTNISDLGAYELTHTIDVSSEADLRAAIFQISNDFATDGVVNDDYVISITGDIDLTQSLPMIRGDGIHTITINGNGHTIDAHDSGRVFFVESGKVEINDVTIANAYAQGGDGGDGGASVGTGGGGGLGAGAAVFVNEGAEVTLASVQVASAAAVGGSGGDGSSFGPFGAGGGGGGGIGGNGGNAIVGGGGGGGYEGQGGNGSDGAGGGGGEFGVGGTGDFIAAGGGGGQQGNGGSASTNDGGGGGGAAVGADGGSGATGGDGGGNEGGDGGDVSVAGQSAQGPLGGGGGGSGFGGTVAGGDGADSGGGGGGGGGAAGASGNGGVGGVGGGGGGGSGVGAGGNGGVFGGGGGGLEAGVGDGGFGGGGGGAHPHGPGGTSNFGGGGGGGGNTGGEGGDYAGNGGAGAGADGGGGAALGGAVFVRDGGTLIIKDSSFTGTYGVTGGQAGSDNTGDAENGEAHGNVMFLHGATSSTTIEVSTGHTTTIGGGSNALAGGIDGDGALTKTGDGTLALTGANFFSGGTKIDAGTVAIGHYEGFGTGDVAMAAGTTLVFTVGGINIANDIGLTGDPIFFVGSGDFDSISGDITDTSPGPDAGEVEKTGDGTLILSGDNTYTGATRINAGALAVFGGNAIGDASAVSIADGAALDVRFHETIGSLSGAGTVQDADGATYTLTTGADNTSTVFSGSIIDGANALALAKIGTGTQTLSGVSAYTGATTVTAGTLKVDGSIVSATTVGNGGTLGGNGTTGAVAVASGGTLAPGASAGILHTGAASLVAGAHFAEQLGGTTAGAGGYDQLDVHGTVALGGAALDLALIGSFHPVAGTTFEIIANDGSDPISGTFVGLAQGATFTAAGGRYKISYAGGDGNDVTLTALGAAPVITSNGGNGAATVSVAENDKPVTHVTATDTDGDPLAFSLAGGADAAVFVIDPTSGALAFKNAPDFEAPADANHDNVFEVVVKVADGIDGSDTQSLSVTVTNVDGVTIVGTKHGDKVDALHTASGQPLPTGEEDFIAGGNGRDRLSGVGGNDELVGGKGNDRLKGGDGDDRLDGGLGKNKLEGGDGHDAFVFASDLVRGIAQDPWSKGSYARIKDFTLGEDRIELDHSIFKELAAGPLDDAAFNRGSAAEDKSDRIVYNSRTGALSYDHDGKGGDDAIHFATLAKHLDLGAASFLVT